MDTFSGGVVSMARNTLPAVELVRRGDWTLDQMERWLKAVIANDVEYIREATDQITAKLTS